MLQKYKSVRFNQTILYFTELQIEFESIKVIKLERKSGLDELFTSGSIVRSNSDDFMFIFFSQRLAEGDAEARRGGCRFVVLQNYFIRSSILKMNDEVKDSQDFAIKLHFTYDLLLNTYDSFYNGLLFLN